MCCSWHCMLILWLKLRVLAAQCISIQSAISLFSTRKKESKIIKVVLAWNAKYCIFIVDASWLRFDHMLKINSDCPIPKLSPNNILWYQQHTNIHSEKNPPGNIVFFLTGPYGPVRFLTMISAHGRALRFYNQRNSMMWGYVWISLIMRYLLHPHVLLSLSKFNTELFVTMRSWILQNLLCEFILILLIITCYFLRKAH